MVRREPSALRVLPSAPSAERHDLQLVRPFIGWRPPQDDEARVLHLRPLHDATRTALCGVRVVPVEVQMDPVEVVLCLDCAQERRALRGRELPAGAGAHASRHATGA